MREKIPLVTGGREGHQGKRARQHADVSFNQLQTQDPHGNAAVMQLVGYVTIIFLVVIIAVLGYQCRRATALAESRLSVIRLIASGNAELMEFITSTGPQP